MPPQRCLCPTNLSSRRRTARLCGYPRRPTCPGQRRYAACRFIGHHWLPGKRVDLESHNPHNVFDRISPISRHRPGRPREQARAAVGFPLEEAVVPSPPSRILRESFFQPRQQRRRRRGWPRGR
jgi:hypothetical protein